MKHRETALVAVRKLRPNKRNARTHPQKQIRQIQSAYRRFGWTNPIIADENNVILAGHGRYEAALQLGLLEGTRPVKATGEPVWAGGLLDQAASAAIFCGRQFQGRSSWMRLAG